MLSKEDLQRYNRQIIIPDFGQEGQEKLKNSSVLVIGAGGLGAPILQYLTASGLGRLGIVEFDEVSIYLIFKDKYYSIRTRLVNPKLKRPRKD